MGQRILLIDDLDEVEASQTVRFGYRGKSYEIDLSEEHADEFDAGHLGKVLEREQPKSAAAAHPQPNQAVIHGCRSCGCGIDCFGATLYRATRPGGGSAPKRSASCGPGVAWVMRPHMGMAPIRGTLQCTTCRSSEPGGGLGRRYFGEDSTKGGFTTSASARRPRMSIATVSPALKRSRGDR